MSYGFSLIRTDRTDKTGSQWCPGCGEVGTHANCHWKSKAVRSLCEKLHFDKREEEKNETRGKSLERGQRACRREDHPRACGKAAWVSAAVSATGAPSHSLSARLETHGPPPDLLSVTHPQRPPPPSPHAGISVSRHHRKGETAR